MELIHIGWLNKRILMKCKCGHPIAVHLEVKESKDEVYECSMCNCLLSGLEWAVLTKWRLKKKG